MITMAIDLPHETVSPSARLSVETLKSNGIEGDTCGKEKKNKRKTSKTDENRRPSLLSNANLVYRDYQLKAEEIFLPSKTRDLKVHAFCIML